jgi:Major Facilitator Superfamily
MNGNVGIIRTMVAEMCPWKELQPRAFSVMPLVWNLGSVLGPAFGGALSNPYKRSPEDNSNGPLLWQFPYALPNIVCACFFLVGIVTGFFYLDETLASKKGRRDYGRMLGQQMADSVSRQITRISDCWKRARGQETEPLLSRNRTCEAPDDEEAGFGKARPRPSEKQQTPSVREVLTKQTTLNLIVYTFLAAHSVAFDQVLPVFLHHPRFGKDVERIELPLRFSRGFGLRSGAIGLFFTMYGVVGIVFQFLVFPPLARRFGVLNCLRAVMAIMPVTYFFLPFTSLIDDVFTAECVLFAIWIVKGLCTTFAFPCTTILLTNSASSLRVLATVNGIATSVSAVGRALGPVFAGAVFTWGVKEGYMIAPFWLLAGIGVLGAAASWLLVEGEGFGNSDCSGADSSSEMEDDEDAVKPVAVESDVPETDEDYNFTPLLSREWTRHPVTSQAVSEAEDEEDDAPYVQPIIGSHPGSYGTHMTKTPGSRRASASAGHLLSAPRRRRSSAPIGTGPGFRRLSSNLGQSRSGYGNGGGLAG